MNKKEKYKKCGNLPHITPLKMESSESSIFFREKFIYENSKFVETYPISHRYKRLPQNLQKRRKITI